MDTALALQALKAANYSDTTVQYQAIKFLTTNQNTDGGWGFTSGDISNTYVTSIVLRTLAAYNSVFINQDSINLAAAFLLAKQAQNNDGGFGSSPSTVYETALSFMALVESGQGNGQDSILPLQNAINYLTTAQLANGSWNDDPYSTALALQALAKVKPNLLSSSISFSKPMPQEGEEVTISATVNNNGLETASNVIVRFYLGDPASDGTQLGIDQVIPSLTPNSSAPISVTAFFTGTGGKTIFVVVDPDGMISETSEADNKASARIWVATGPDLAVSSEDLKPSTFVPTSGTAFTLEYVVRNLGESAADGFDVALYDGDPASGGALLQTGHISGLNGIEVRTGTFGVTLTGDGPHTLYLVADPGSLVPELSETNNTGSVTVTVGGTQTGADLAITSADITLNPSRPTTGQTVAISAKVRNQGVDAVFGFLVELYDGSPEAGGTLIKSETISLAAGGEQLVSANWSIPAGIHDLYVIVDRSNGIVESDENNNRASIRVMTDMVDISLSATDLIFTPAHPVMGDTVALTMTAHNTGIVHTGPFNLSLYDGDPAADGVLLQTFPIANIAGDGSATVTHTFTAEPKLYRFNVEADTENVVAEMYEENNLAIRSLKIKAPGEVLGPDLVPIKIDLSGSATDSQTLAISGNAQVTFQNKGDAKIELPFNVTVFEDNNNDGVYTSGVDNLLGTSTMVTGPTATIPAIWPEGAGMVSVPLAGTVTFLHSPLYAIIDSGDAILEQDETNNYLASCKDCEVVPSNPIQPVVKWRFNQQNSIVSVPPTVVNLTDTNGDGKIDTADVPNIVFGVFSGYNTAPKTLFALRGDTGATVFSASDPTSHPIGSFPFNAAGDIDGDGLPEIIVPGGAVPGGGGVLVYNHDGTLKWDNHQALAAWNASHSFSSQAMIQDRVVPVIADLDGDGTPEIVMSNTVINPDGTIRCSGGSGGYPGPGMGAFYWSFSSLVADLDMNGTQEIVAGNTAYNADCTIKWRNTALTDGLTALGNFNDDSYPEIVLVTYYSPPRVYLLDHLGNILWGPVSLKGLEPETQPNYGLGGPPVVADFDGDGELEIGIKGFNKYFILDKDGNLKNTLAIPYQSDGSYSAPTVFDLNGDGRPEVLINSDRYFRVFDGKDGTLLYSEPFGAASNSLQNVLIADVDNDGHAEVVAVGWDYNSVTHNSMRVYGSAGNNWVNARKIWNQASYHVTNVNDDGTIPQYEAPSWLLNNTYRTQAAIGPNPNPYLTPNLTASLLHASRDSTGVNLTVRVGNGGAKEALAGVSVTFYDGMPATGTVLGTALTTRVLQPGEYQDLVLGVSSLADGLHRMVTVVDEANAISECNETDNQTELDLTIATGLPDLKVGSEDIAIPASLITEGNIIPLTVTVKNIGLVAASNVEVKLSNGNPASGGVWIGLPQTISTIDANGSAALTFTFDTLGHGGQNIVYVSLDPDNTIVEATRANNIALVSIDVQPPQLPNFVIGTNSIQFVPADPREGEQVSITATVTNRGAATGNVPVQISVGSQEPGASSQELGTRTIYPILSLGQSATITTTFDTAGLAGQRSIVVAIDPANAITESDETDNDGTMPVFIQSAGLMSSVLLDKAAYQANENLTATITLVSTATDTRSLVPTITVKDSAGNVIAAVSSGDVVTLGPNDAATLTRTWNIGNNLAGNYALTTEVAEGNLVVSRSSAAFSITADTNVSTSVTVDKISYNPNETAALTAVITSLSANYVQENMSATMTIVESGGQGPGSSTIYTQTKTITTLMPGSAFTFKSYWNTGTYAPGAYPVTLEVKDASGSLITTGTATVTITDVIKPSAMLKGTIAVDNQSLLSGETATVSYSVTNNGNIDLQNVELSVLIVHVVNQTVYDTLASQATFSMGATYAHTAVVDTTNRSAMDYLVVLRANIAGVEETLAGTYFRVEGAPTAAALISPAMGSDVDIFTPALTVSNASDPNDDRITYEFELYADAGLSQLVVSSGFISQGTGTTAWTAPFDLTENATYYWRARAYDGKLYGPWMEAASFRVNTINEPPTAPASLSPADTTSVSVLTPILTVTNASDPDSANLTYNFQVALDPDFTQIVAPTIGIFEGPGTTSWQVSPALSENTWYYWRALADDWQIEGPWSTTAAFFVNTTNDKPAKPVILSPSGNAVVTSLYADIVLQNSMDIDSSVISYFFEVDTDPAFNSAPVIRSGILPAGPGTTTWQATGLLDNTLYYVRAMAIDDGSAESGWTDAVEFFVNTANDKPIKPVIANPSIGAEVNVLTPTLTVHNATDPDRDQLTYEFEVYSDSAFTNLVATVTGIAETTSTTSWTVTTELLENQTYSWRARAFDGSLYSDWAEAWFVVNKANDAPDAPALYSPLDGATIATFLPTLSITNAVDPDSDALTYEFEVYAGSTLVAASGGVRGEAGGETTSWPVPTALADNTTYQWKARAFDGDRYGPWMNMAAFTVHVQQAGINVEIEVEPETLNQTSHGNWVMVEIELPHGYQASDVDLSSIRLEGVVPAETRPYGRNKHHRDHGCEHDRAKHDHDELKVKFDRNSVIAVLPNGDHVPVHVTGRIGSAEFEGVDFIRVIH